MNLIPYYYDELWRDYQIDYYSFNGFELVKDLSMFTNEIKVIILIFKKENENYLFGFDDGILFPFFGEKIFNFNSDNYKEFINRKIDEITIEIKKYYSKEIKIFMEPYTQYKLGFNLFDYFKINNESHTDLFHIIDKTNLTKNMKFSIRNIINKYNKSKIFNDCPINIHYGCVEDTIFDKFKDKHYDLAGKHTKSEKCWNILKEFINQKKAVLINYQNDFVYFFVAKNLSYYGINACTKKSDICIVLIYEAIKFCTENDYNYIYLYHYEMNSPDQKTSNLSYFKKSLANQIITNYIGKY